MDGNKRVTVTVYVEVVIPSWAVTTVAIVLVPTTSGIAALEVPDATVVPLTWTVDVTSNTVGVIVIEVVAYGTLAV